MKPRKFLFSGGLATSACLNSDKQEGANGEGVKSQLLKTDVLVVGGRPSGIGAAIGAAKTGVMTVLIENSGFFGGVASWGLGMPINQMRPLSKPRGVVHELLFDKLLNLGNQAVHIGQHQLYCNVDYLKVADLYALEGALKVNEIQEALRKDEVDLTMGGKVQEKVSSDRKV